jgi:hypothetical protein
MWNRAKPNRTEHVHWFVFSTRQLTTDPVAKLEVPVCCNECKRFGWRSSNHCSAFKIGLLIQRDSNYQNRDLTLKQWEVVAAECDYSYK